MSQEDNPKKIFTIETANYVLLSFIALVEAIYFLIFLCFVFHFVPLSSIFQGHVLTEWQWHLKPEREIFFYRTSVFFCVGLAVALFLFFKDKMESVYLRQSFFRYLIIKVTLLTVILISLYKIIIYGQLLYFTYVIYVAFGLAVFVKIFWFKSESFFQKVSISLEDRKINTILTRVFNIVIPALIILLLFVPDLKSVFARIFMEDLLYHYDGIIMGATWAFLKGLKIHMDIVYQHGIGLPIVIGILTKISGGLSYENVIRILMYLSLVYFILCYFFMKTWLRSALVAFVGMMLIIKFQVFHYGVSNPYIWKHPSNLPIRFLLDLPCLLFILLHLRTSQKRYLLLSGFTVGLALFYMTDSGIYLFVTFFVYLISLLILPQHRDLLYRSKRDCLFIASCFLVPIFIFLTLLWTHLGGFIFTKQFWFNFSETTQLFLNGLFVLPIYTLIEEKYFQGFFAGFVVPLLYLINLLFLGGSVLTKKMERERLFPFLLSVYGLCLYHYYMGRSSHTYFYVVIIPLIFILCYWLKEFVQSLSTTGRQAVLGLTAFFSFSALFMTQSFIEYPNVLAIKKISYEKERQLLAKEYSFEKDAALIRNLTVEDEPVALFSSFEVALLMAADRKPFFYYFPLTNPRYRNMKDFGGTYLITQERLQRTLDQLEKEKPRYIFVEGKFLGGVILPIYYEHYVSLRVLVAYLQEKYVPQTQGEYLVALRRKN